MGDPYPDLAQNLIDRGYSLHIDGVPPALSQMLWDDLCQSSPRQFHQAGIGANQDTKINQLVRKDEISWIDGKTLSEQAWLDWVETLRSYLNEHLFLGLTSFESHFARYNKGDFYQRHKDAFKGAGNRKLSIVIYLNKHYLESDGGNLILYENEASLIPIIVKPEYGTFVIFMSDEIPHEVLESNRERLSIAGWFR